MTAAARVLAFKPGLDIEPITFPNRRSREVFRALVSHINRQRAMTAGDLDVYPSVETLGEESYCSARTARRGLRDLQEAGLIEPVDVPLKSGGTSLKDGKPKGGHRVPRYRILASLSTDKMSGQGGQKCPGRADKNVRRTVVLNREKRTSSLRSLRASQRASRAASHDRAPSQHQRRPFPSDASNVDRTPAGNREAARAPVGPGARARRSAYGMAEREALTAAEADRILKPANRCRVGHQHAPDRFAEDAELVRCRCGAVRKAHEQHKRLRIWDSSWWLGCPPTVDTASTDEPLFEEPADDDETTFGVVPEWGPVPELAPVRQGPHQHAKAKHVDEGDHWRLVCACGRRQRYRRWNGRTSRHGRRGRGQSRKIPRGGRLRRYHRPQMGAPLPSKPRSSSRARPKAMQPGSASGRRRRPMPSTLREPVRLAPPRRRSIDRTDTRRRSRGTRR